jgi:hypothetical protein
VVAALLFALCAGSKPAVAQETQTESTDSIRGTVVNSVTHEPIGHALVYSPDNRFATMTDGEGHFEFTLPKTQADNSTAVSASYHGPSQPDRPYMLRARKPGYLDDPNDQASNLRSTSAKEITIPLVPEALIVGRVSLPTSEPPDRIQLEIYRREVQEGRPRWIQAGMTTSKSNGEFRFAELAAGSYKLFTRELQDRDPQTTMPGGQIYGYAPAYFPTATSFGAAGTIQLQPGQIVQADLSLVKQPYYPVKIPVANVSPGMGLGITVSPNGRKGPGFALGYNDREQSIEGTLPNGSFIVEATTYGETPTNGSVNITVHNGRLAGPLMTLVSGRPISVNVKEEFTSTERTSSSSWSVGGRTFSLRGPRAYLNITLVSTDEFDQQRNASLRPPSGAEDDSLIINSVQPGAYWVEINSGRGFPSSVTSGGVDLLHEPLMVGAGGTSPPIEITMTDDGGKIEGNIEGANAPTAAPQRAFSSPTEAAVVGPVFDASPSYIYCIPLPDSTGRFTQIVPYADGKFTSPILPPGVYRVLAFKRPQTKLEYRNPEAMKAYDTEGPTVRIVPGKTEHLQLHLIN